MWFEIIPSFGIVVVALAVPHFSAYVINKLVIGNSYRKSLIKDTQKVTYLRDKRIGNGDPYNTIGLEGIPDS